MTQTEDILHTYLMQYNYQYAVGFDRFVTELKW